VFFDELGPPWPKHPCTIREYQRLGNKSGGSNDAPAASWRKEGWKPADLVGSRRCEQGTVLSLDQDGTEIELIVPVKKFSQFKVPR